MQQKANDCEADNLQPSKVQNKYLHILTWKHTGHLVNILIICIIINPKDTFYQNFSSGDFAYEQKKVLLFFSLVLFYFPLFLLSFVLESSFLHNIICQNLLANIYKMTAAGNYCWVSRNAAWRHVQA